jgi:acyl-CoA synthetase (AMP-forming)/AMP-acid ligase II
MATSITSTISNVPDELLETLPLAHLIEHHAAHSPDASFTVFPGAHPGAAPDRVSFLEFARGAQRFARAIFPDAPVKDREVVGVVLTADSLAWTTAIAGIIRAGCTVSV